MKRNKTTARAQRKSKGRKGPSKYAQKRASGNMMYGPGCCANKVKLDYWAGGGS